MSCAHESFIGDVKVQRLLGADGAVANYLAEFQVKCADCDAQFHFRCPDTGLSFRKPTVDVFATTLHAPIAPGAAPLPTAVRFEVPRD